MALADVQDFGDLGLYRIYQVLANGSGVYNGLTEQQMFDILNGSSSLGEIQTLIDPVSGLYASRGIASISDRVAFGNTSFKNLNNVVQQITSGGLYTKILKNVNIINQNSYDVFVKFWGLPSASVTIGTTAVNYKIQVPAFGSVILNDTNFGLVEGEQLSMAVTQGYLDSNITAVATNVEAFVSYKTS